MHATSSQMANDMVEEHFPTISADDWHQAPNLVQSVYHLNIAGAIISACLIVVSGCLLYQAPPEQFAERALNIGFAAGLGTTCGYLALALRRNTPLAWATQLVLLTSGLFAFPIGTLVFGYFLFHWFKPEVRAWFNRNKF